uniref:Uncharacterized protein n=1 Tax=Panagrolaimus sp. ES5 TaxID=591445 RepID=A0AC34FJD1_9BILA
MQKVFDFYQIDDLYAQNNPIFYFEKFTEVHTDTVMKIPMAKEIDAKLDREPYTTSGITHTDEEKMVQKYFAEMLGSFVKSGKPTVKI